MPGLFRRPPQPHQRPRRSLPQYTPPAASAYADAIIADAPVAYWRLGEPSGTNANDEIGTLDGTYANTPALGVTGPLHDDANTAVTFDGTDYIDVPDNAVLDFGTGSFSVEVWAKRGDADVDYKVIYSKGSQGNAYFLDNKFTFDDNNSPSYVRESGTTTDAFWHHFVVTISGAGTVRKVYKDGIDVSEQGAAFTGLASNGDAARIADYYPAGATSIPFIGTLDEVALYNYALTPAQVLNHYEIGVGGAYPAAVRADTPIAYWRLGEPSGTNANDEIGSNDGTFVDTPTLAAAGALAGDADTAVTFASASTEHMTAGAVAVADVGSIEFWMKRSGTSNSHMVLLGRGTNSFMMGMNDSNGDGRVEIYKGGVADFCRSSVLINDTTTWHHVVGTKPAVGGGEPKIYIDGVDVTVFLASNATTSNPGTTIALAANPTPAFPFDGSLDEVAIYDYELTPAQVLNHFEAGVGGAYPAAVRGSQPAGYWRLGEPSGTNANDEVGSNDGTYVNTPTLGLAGALSGDTDTGVAFNGSDEYVTIPDGAAYSLGTTGQLSVECWAYALTDAGLGVLVGKYDGTTAEWDLKRNGDQFQIHVRELDGSNRAYVFSANIPAPTGWHHFVATMDDATDTLILYVDGIEAGRETTWGGVSTSGSAPVNIGRRGDNTWYLDGSVDEVAIYNYVLTPSQIAAHFEVGAGGPYAAAVRQDAPSAYWRFGELSGTVAREELGINPGTYVSTPTLGTTGPLHGDDDTAVTFNGTDEHVTVPDAPALDMGATCSWEFWFKRNATGSLMYFLSKGGDQPNIQWRADNFLQVGDETNTLVISDIAITDTGWHHCVFVHAGTAAIDNRLYIDGIDVSDPSTQNGVTLVPNGTDLSIGASYGSPTLWYSGSLDEISIYAHVLTPTQVGEHYVAGTGASGTNAAAGLASGTGAAANASTKVSPNAGHAAGTGAAANASASVKASAGAATGTGAAANASTSIKASAGAAAGTGAAANAPAKVSPNAGHAAGTGTASGASKTVAPTSGVATGTGTAYNTGKTVAATAGHASGTGAANNATKTVAPNAGHSSGTGAAFNAGGTSSASIGHAAGTGAAANAGKTIAVNAGHASGTGAAHNAAGLVAKAVSPTTATGTGAAANASSSIAVNAGHAAGTGAAANTTVSITDTAPADAATGTGAAHNATTSVVASSGVASGTGAAHNATVATGAQALAGVAAGTGAASNAAASIAVAAGHAAGTGAASDAGKTVAPNAGHAAGTGAALNAAGSVLKTVSPTAATGTGSANAASTKVAPTAGAAAGAGAAGGLSASVAVSAGVATGTGAASNATVQVAKTVSPTTASGTGTANNASTAIAPTSGVAPGTGSAAGASTDVKASASAASGTGAAFNATAAVVKAVSPTTATGTGSASNAAGSVASSSGAASGTGSAGALSADIKASAAPATGTGAAFNAIGATAVSAAAGAATGTGAAAGATTSIAPVVGAATGTGAAHGASGETASNVYATAGTATGTGAAHDATTTIAGTSGTATGSGAAGAATPSIGASSGAASGTGTASGPALSVSVNAAAATGTGTAHDATVTTSSETNAPASVASGTGAAFDASISLATSASAATGSGAAAGATSSVAAGTGAATGTGAAAGPALSVAVNATNAAGSGSAFDATVTTSGATQAAAGAATGTGTALSASIDMATRAASSAGAGSASPASPWILVNAGAATGTGAAFNATVTTSSATTANAGAATGTGQAFNATTTGFVPDVGGEVGASFGLRYTVGTAAVVSETTFDVESDDPNGLDVESILRDTVGASR